MSKVSRDAKLVKLGVDVQAVVSVELARITKEAVWLRIIQARVGLGAVKSSVAPAVDSALLSELEDYLGG